MALPTAPTSSSSACSASARGTDSVADACGAAVESLSGDPGLLVAFTAGLEDPGRAAAQLHEVAAGAPAVGMTGKGVFGINDPIDDGCVAVAFESGIESAVGIGSKASEDFRAAGRNATRVALDQLSGEASLLMLLVDVSGGDLAQAIAGSYEVARELPMAGGASSGEPPFQYAGGQALTDAVIAVAIHSPRKVGIGNAHSCSVVGDRSLVTRSEGRVIVEIDGRPAEEVYLERVGGRADLEDEAFEAMAITHPIAQPESHGNRRLRHVLGRWGGGGLLCSTNIPENAVIEFTVLSQAELVRSACDSIGVSVEAIGNRDPEAVLLFDCAGRRRVLGHGQAQEVRAISESFVEPPPLAGLYTDGEVARLSGPKGDHNHAVVTVTFA